MKFYTGIGSRSTPPDVLTQMTAIARQKAKEGIRLRSGGADGADTAFETGAGPHKEIWLPWTWFNGRVSIHLPTPEAFVMAASVHPNWSACSPAARKLHARNCHQVLGSDLKTPSEDVICWTPNGCVVGGTATALKIAKAWGIPILNLGAKR